MSCRAPGQPDRKRTGTPCGTPGAPGANVPVPVVAVPHTPSDGASVPSKALSSDSVHRENLHETCNSDIQKLGLIHRVCDIRWICKKQVAEDLHVPSVNIRCKCLLW